MSDLDINLNVISKIDKFDDVIYAAAFLQNEEGVVTISGDRTVRILIKRDGGFFWPTVCDYLTDSVLCMHFAADSRKLFIGLANGVIQEFIISEDYNRLSHRRDYLGQIGRIRAVCFSSVNEWLFSCGSSPQIMQHCLQSGVLLSSAKIGSWGMCLQVDETAKFVFVGELAGHVTMLAATQNSLSIVKRVQRHSGCITRLLWHAPSQWLFSSSSDGLVCCWDFGGGNGDVFELRAHQSSVNALALIGNESSRLLLTCGDDGALLAWKMDQQTLRKRRSVPKWVESDNCMICNTPFFWNVKAIANNVKAAWFQKFPRSVSVDQGAAGSGNGGRFGETTELPGNNSSVTNSSLPIARQHHCRRCGQAICGNCSNSNSVLPIYGFELPVRVCSTCAKQIAKDEIVPLCSTRPFSTGHAVIGIDTRPALKHLLTVGRDRVIKIWDAKNLFAAASK